MRAGNFVCLTLAFEENPIRVRLVLIEPQNRETFRRSESSNIFHVKHSPATKDGSVSRTLCVVNQKGGVGKTTTAINLAAGLAISGQRALLIDMDPQCNATTGTGNQPVTNHPLIVNAPINSSVSTRRTKHGFDLLPGSKSFNDSGVLASPIGPSGAAGNNQTASQELVMSHLTEGANQYDYVLIDCPPSVGTLTRAALSVADEVLMPIQCEFFAMEGLAQMISVIKSVMLDRPGQLTFGGIVLTMYDESLDLTHEVDAEVREFFGEIVFDTVVPRDVKVAESPSHGLCVLDYAPRCRGSRAYTELCMEMLERD